MTVYSLRVPGTAEQSTYFWEGRFTPADTLRIPGLSGCMGALLVCQNEALLVHDSNDGYPHAKQKMDDFLTRHPATNVIHINCRDNWNQRAWLRDHHRKEPTSFDFFRAGGVTLEHRGNMAPVGAEQPSQSVGEPIRRTNLVARFNFTKNDWDPDNTTDHCTVCNVLIVGGWLSTNKHHCRMCGHITCDECSPKMNAGLGRGLVFPTAPQERVCYNCVPRKNLYWT